MGHQHLKARRLSLQNYKIIFFFVAALMLFLLVFPFRNWLEVRGERKKKLFWENWLIERPFKEGYISKTTKNPDVIKCNFCSYSRIFPSPEVGVVERLSFGFIHNSSQGSIHYKTYICSGCGSHLYRERIM